MLNPERSDDYFDELLSSQFALIRQIIACAARQHRLGDADAQEFESWVSVKLVEHDRAVLRKFRGESNLRTYLTVVIARWCKDFRIMRWGKWRSSAAAKRLGPLAIELERLINRDGLSFDEACEHLRSKHGIAFTDGELQELRTPPSRGRPRQVDEQELSHLAADSPDAEELAMRDERRAGAARLEETLARLIEELDPQDQLILKLHFTDDLSVAEISRALGLEQAPLYRRLERLQKNLRKRMGDEGFDGGAINRYLGDADEAGPDHEGGIAGGSPSL